MSWQCFPFLQCKSCFSFSSCSDRVHHLAAERLVECKALHPCDQGREVPVVPDMLVKADKGTGCVHLAPGCGREDYLAGRQHGLEVFCPVSPDGHYTAEAPYALRGKTMAEGQTWGEEHLAKEGR